MCFPLCTLLFFGLAASRAGLATSRQRGNVLRGHAITHELHVQNEVTTHAHLAVTIFGAWIQGQIVATVGAQVPSSACFYCFQWLHFYKSYNYIWICTYIDDIHWSGLLFFLLYIAECVCRCLCMWVCLKGIEQSVDIVQCTVVCVSTWSWESLHLTETEGGRQKLQLTCS